MNKHDTLLNNLYWKLKDSGKYQHLGREQKYVDRELGKGETDVLAIDLKRSELDIFEVKSSHNIGKAYNQLRRAKHYYKQFEFKTTNFYIFFPDKGLEREILVDRIRQ